MLILPGVARVHKKFGVKLGALPSGGGALNPFDWHMFVKINGLRTMDNRKSNGALWVLAENLPAHIEAQLSAWGFRLRRGKGWWKE